MSTKTATVSRRFFIEGVGAFAATTLFGAPSGKKSLVSFGLVTDCHYADLPLACYNRGIGGDTTDGVLARLQTSAIDLHPSKIVLMIGTNDVGGRRNNDAILENYRNILQTLHTALPDCEIYCVSVIPQNQLLGTFAIESNERIRVLNPGIKALAEEYGAAYLDLFPLLEDEDGMLIASCSDDGIHLNAAGFRIWTDLLKPYLE